MCLHCTQQTNNRTGVTITKASFFTQSAPETKPIGPELIWRWESYVKGGATNTSMECAPLFLIGASLGIRTSCVMVSATNCKEYDGQGESQPLKNLEDRAIQAAIEGMLSPEIQEKIIANLEIRETFKISKVGTIAGCMCLDGKILRTSKVRIIRDGIVVYTGKLASLKRFKDDVKEVVSGQDCGLSVENFNDIKTGDIVEAYEEIEVKRKL